MTHLIDCISLSDRVLLARLKLAVARERIALISLLSYLAEADRRELYATESYPSLFAFCIGELKYSEGAAYRRIHAARAARKYVAIYSLLAEGNLSLGVISMLAPHLTTENSAWLLDRAQGKSKRDVQFLLTSFVPKRERSDSSRCLPGSKNKTFEPSEPVIKEMILELESSSQSETDSVTDTETGEESRGKNPQRPFPNSILLDRRQSVEPISPERARIAFDCDKNLLQKLKRVCEVLRHKFPSGKYEDVFNEALEAVLDKWAPERKIEKKRKTSNQGYRKRNGASNELNSSGPVPTRRIAQRIKDEVWIRDGGRCAYENRLGKRCGERGGIEYDHVIPWAKGGRSDEVNNIRLLCRSHNQFMARKVFGRNTDS